MNQTRKIRSVEVIIAASIAVVLVVFGLLTALSGPGGAANAGTWLGFYTHALIGPLVEYFYGAVVFICLIVISLVIWSLGGGLVMAAVRKFRTLKNDKKPTGVASAGATPGAAATAALARDPRKVFFAAAKRSRELLLVIPMFVFVGLAGVAMGEANLFDRVRLADATVAGWEHALFGTYVFAALGAITYPHWLIVFIIWSFENMAIIMVIAGIILAYTAVKRYHELLVALCIGILAMIPIWLVLPALSPQDRFINNIYQLPNPPEIATALANYHPQAEIANFFASVRADKEGLPALPTSTIPSAHIFWAVLTGYYLFRANKWFGWIALPFLLASSYGTMLLAQHYFIDVPAGIAVALFAIWLAHELEEEKVFA